MERKNRQNQQQNIEMTSIQIEPLRKWENDDVVTRVNIKKRKALPTFLFALFVLALVTTAFSVAKYATSYSSGKLASVKSNDFIWNCNLVSYPKMNQNKIIGQYPISLECYSMSNAYVDFDVKNFVTADAITNTNSEDIEYRIKLSDGSNLKVVNKADSMDAVSQSITMSGGSNETQTYRIEPNGVLPGFYEGTVTIISEQPYEKIYEQDIKIELKDIYIGGKWENGKVIYVIHNGVVDKTIMFSYSTEINCISLVLDGNTSTPDQTINGTKNEVTVSVPAGKNAELTFIKTPGYTIAVDEITYSY